ncbi:MAG TPA: hypothetical protein VEZ11_08540 [Thermoanaerobaculia bacterium]|nr:hypothetical protein [Thermoanaerobaculia bacterium]
MKPLLFFFALITSLASAPLPSPAPSAPALVRIDRDNLCVTNGVVSTDSHGTLEIDTPSSRAVVRNPTAHIAEIRFRYLGPSSSSKPLASGELRRQIGLKLRAQDTCNLLYVMWHIEPDSRIAVSIKRNPGKNTHEECGAHGYINIKPRMSVPTPRILRGDSHTLRAELHGTNLSVVADGKLVWEGPVGDEINEIDGPVGFRTDNARFAFEYYAGVPNSASPPSERNSGVSPCHQSGGD